MRTIDVLTLQEKLIAHPELIETVLNKLGHNEVTDKGRYFTTSNLDGDNKSAISILKENLVYSNFTRNSRGNIFTLVQEELQCNFKSAIKKIGKWIGCKDESNIVIHEPFGGFYKRILAEQRGEIVELPIHSESELPLPDSLSSKFLHEGCALVDQERFGIRFCHEDNSILIPWIDQRGKLVGCKARSNIANCDLSKRWSMYLRFQTSQVVYGWYQNYKYIVEKRTVIVVEAEKSVVQAFSFGCKIVVAIGGHNISKSQARLIKALMAERIIVAFDQDLPEAEIKFEAKKLISDTKFIKNKVQYIYDAEGEYLPKGSKLSPTDKGKKVFKNLIKKHLHNTYREE